jgi:hypothetical protein
MGTHQLPSAERATCQDSERKRAGKGTHVLSSAEGGTHQDSEIKLETRGAHVLSSGHCWDSEKGQRAMSTHQLSNAEGRPRPSGQWEKASKPGALTSCQADREKLVRIKNNSQ